MIRRGHKAKVKLGPTGRRKAKVNSSTEFPARPANRSGRAKDFGKLSRAVHLGLAAATGVRALKRENPAAPTMNVFVKGFVSGQLSLL